MTFQIIKNHINRVKADIIVNTVGPRDNNAGGIDMLGYEAAGKDELLTQGNKIVSLKPGEVTVAPAFELNARYIIYAAGPSWHGVQNEELKVLEACYTKSLYKALELGCDSIAFPLISTGVYGIPEDKTLDTAMSVISRFLMNHDMKVLLVVFQRKSLELSGQLFQDMDDYIKENYVKTKAARTYKGTYNKIRQLEECSTVQHISEVIKDEETCPINQEELCENKCDEGFKDDNLDNLISNVGETFQQRLLYLIDTKGLSDTVVYKKANMDRKLFSKIRCNVNYKPRKKTVLALAVALELNLEETKDLLSRAELALSPSSKFDLIIEYFIIRKVYDIYTINMALFKHNQQTLA